MGAFIIEIQNSTIVTPIPHYTEEQVADRTALSAWYTKCGVAVASSVEMHTIILMSDNGSIIKKEVFTHSTEE